MESYHTDATHIHEIISKNIPTIPTSSTKCHMIFMLGSGTELIGRFRLFPSVRYCILPGVVWCSAVHTFSHTRYQTPSDIVFVLRYRHIEPFLCQRWWRFGTAEDIVVGPRAR